MIKKQIISNISFADSEYKSFHMSENSTLTIHMKSWEEKPFQIIFSGTIQFLYSMGDVPKNLYEIFDHSNFLIESLMNIYVEIPSDHPYKLYHLEDIDGFPFIQVVAESVEIIKD